MTDADPTMVRPELVARLFAEAQIVVDAVTQDDCGQLIGPIWMGGNGGLLSRETLRRTDQLRKTLLEIRAFNDQFYDAIKKEAGK